MPTRPQHEHPIRQINHYGAAPTHHSHMALTLITHRRILREGRNQRSSRIATGGQNVSDPIDSVLMIGFDRPDG